MNNQTHPIEHMLVACILFLEGVCWLINEILGHHDQKPAPAPAIAFAHVARPCNDYTAYLHHMRINTLRKVARTENLKVRRTATKADLQQALFSLYTTHQALV